MMSSVAPSDARNNNEATEFDLSPVFEGILTRSLKSKDNETLLLSFSLKSMNWSSLFFHKAI